EHRPAHAAHRAAPPHRDRPRPRPDDRVLPRCARAQPGAPGRQRRRSRRAPLLVRARRPGRRPPDLVPRVPVDAAGDGRHRQRPALRVRGRVGRGAGRVARLPALERRPVHGRLRPGRLPVDLRARSRQPHRRDSYKGAGHHARPTPYFL
ncbi:MAG: Glyoxalase family protein, partial [uncultured Solirubrobacteraceae bacterium]